MNSLLAAKLACWLECGERVVGVSVVETQGSSPHSQGLAMLVSAGGEIAGAVSGGCVDGAIVEACEDVLARGHSRSAFFAAEDGAWGNVGLVCGGSLRVWVYEMEGLTAHALVKASAPCCLTLRGPLEQGPTHMEVTSWAGPPDKPRTSLRRLPNGGWEFEEVFGRAPLLLLVGQSGFTSSLAALGRFLGCEVQVCEPRSRFAASIAQTEQVVRELPGPWIESLDQQGRLHAESAIIVCTHDAKFDVPALLAAVRSRAGFIGAMGSRKTVAERRQRLLQAGLREEDLARIHAPAGLDLRAETPAETAVSVLAGWIAHRYGGSGLPLTQGEGTIHGRD